MKRFAFLYPALDIIDTPCRAELYELAKLLPVSSGFAGRPRRRLRIRPWVNELSHRDEQYQGDSCRRWLCRTPWSQLSSMRGWQVDRVGLGTARTTPPACWHSDQPSKGRPPTACDSSFDRRTWSYDDGGTGPMAIMGDLHQDRNGFFAIQCTKRATTTRRSSSLDSPLARRAASSLS